MQFSSAKITKTKKIKKKVLPISTCKENTLKEEKCAVASIKKSKGEQRCFRIISWNIAGLRSVLNNKSKLEIFSKLVTTHNPDIFSLQEHKLQEVHVPVMKEKLKVLFPDYLSFWACSTEKKGYSGVVVFIKKSYCDERKHKETDKGLERYMDFSKESESCRGFDNEKGTSQIIPSFQTISITKPLIEGSESEGRLILVDLEFSFLLFAYVPNSGADLKRLSYRTKCWDQEIKKLLLDLDKVKPTVLIGDLNVAHRNVDIYNYNASHIPKTPGCTMEERNSFTTLLELGFVDSFRLFCPEETGHYTYWSQRANNRPQNKGLRLDYAVCSKRLFYPTELTPNIEISNSFLLPFDTISVSDHCPIVLEFSLNDILNDS